MQEPAVLFKIINEHIGVVTINRPNKRNAVNGEVAQGIAQLVDATESNPAIRAVILPGAGDQAFCAGIAAVNGFAVAGGLELVLACDMAVASEQVKFGLPEVTRGIIAAAGGMFRLPRILPKAIAMEYLATGKHFPAQLAHQYGMVNRLVPTGKHIEAALELATTIMENAPLAVQESLSIARKAYDLSDAELIQLTMEANARVFQSEDAKEGPLAFVEKRKPLWKGK